MAIKDVILGYAKGEKGDPGPRGEKGNTGATGPKGDPGNIADAQITDTEGLDVAKGQKTTAQKLFDAIANRIVTKLVTNDALTKKLADYMLKGMMSNTNVNNTGTVPTSALMYSMFEQINNNLRNVDAAVKGSLLDYAKNVSTFENVSTGENTADLPNNNARYCVANIMHRANSWFISIEGRDNRLYTNYNNGDSWTGWQATALKSDLANKTKSGSATISTKQNDSTALQIRFDEPFPSRPYVTVSLNTDNANTNTKISVFGIDQIGFKVSIYDTAATTRRIEWIASV